FPNSAVRVFIRFAETHHIHISLSLKSLHLKHQNPKLRVSSTRELRRSNSRRTDLIYFSCFLSAVEGEFGAKRSFLLRF
ncbi:hypothetical protein V2J09_019075, partial [Rumex salicifolius]